MSASTVSMCSASSIATAPQARASSANLFSQVKARGVMQAGLVFGLRLGPGRSLSPCPSCSAPQRGSGDRRGPVGIRPDDQGWVCHRCGATGDAVTLAALCVTKRPLPDKLGWKTVVEACERAGLCSATTTVSASVPSPAEMAPRRPPANELMRLWNLCSAAGTDGEVAVLLRSRGLDVARVEERDLVRALPQNSDLPSWARFCGGPWEESTPWTETSHRLIFPLWGPTGAMETVHARALHPLDVKGRDKAASPAGFQVGGTVMADVTARALLRGDPPGWWRSRDVFVVEGAPDFLTWATRYGDAAEGAPAIIGVIAGSWTEAIADRIPSGCRVLVMTHIDPAGDKYAAAIINSLLGRCSVFRHGGR